jgi:septum site-determining protein MinD
MPGKLLTVFASKGGVGKSFIAVNLAVNLHLETRAKVLFLDYGLPLSVDAAALLDLKKLNGLEPLAPNAAKLAPSLLKGYATPHPSGIDALCANASGRELPPETFSPANTEALLTRLLQVYDYLVLDAGARFEAGLEKALDLSSLILLVTTPGYLALQRCRSDIAFLRLKNFPQDGIKLALNCAGKAELSDRRFIEQTTGKELFGVIPFDADAAASPPGKTYPVDFPRHEAAKAFDELTGKLLRALDQLPSRVAALGAEIEGADLEEDLDALKIGIHQKLLETFDLKHADMEIESNPQRRKELEEELVRRITELLDSQTAMRSREKRAVLVREILQDVLGFGPLEDLLANPEISEIMVNRYDRLYVEKRGLIHAIDKKFVSEKHLMRVIERIVAPLGRKIDTSTPMVDARLKDGSRVNAIIPPLAIHGAALTIRKFPLKRLSVDDLMGYDTLNRQIAEFLKTAVAARLNVLVSGGTGSGKTTLLNVLSGFIPQEERIITVEDSAELRLQQPHVIILESRPPNIEGAGEISIRDLVRNTLRMRPDRIIVGECRGAEALDMLQAMNTGHDGSLTTIHANSPREAVSRLETLVMFAGFELSPRAIKEQIVGAVDLVVQIKRFKDGVRRIVQVTELTGLEGEVVTMGDVFEFKHTGSTPEGRIQGAFVSTGYIPRCLKLFEERGMPLPREIFWTAA